MRGLFEKLLRLILRRAGFDIVPFGVNDADPSDLKIVQQAKPFTMTSAQRLLAMCDGISYVTRAGIEGDVVECGVWKGGSMLAAALKLMDAQSKERTLWLYDTFEGMSAPTDLDRDLFGQSAERQLETSDRSSAVAAYSPLEEVKATMAKSNYPTPKIRYIKGKVEETIPAELPDKIALLRLDTDWYESTKHELMHLFPRLQPGGVLIIDDYGHWEGARQAVDEYLAKQKLTVFLHRIDYSGRVMIKTHPGGG